MNASSARRILRTVLQLIAGGALYGLTQQFAGDVPAQYAPYVLGGYTLAVVVAQNALEDLTGLPAIGKTEASGAKNPVPLIGE